jgi:hypothetical protein
MMMSKVALAAASSFSNGLAGEVLVGCGLARQRTHGNFCPAHLIDKHEGCRRRLVAVAQQKVQEAK